MEHEFVETLKRRRDWLECHDRPMVGTGDEYEALQDLVEFFEPEAVMLEDGLGIGICAICPNCGADPFDSAFNDGPYEPYYLKLLSACGTRYCVNCGKAVKVVLPG